MALLVCALIFNLFVSVEYVKLTYSTRAGKCYALGSASLKIDTVNVSPLCSLIKLYYSELCGTSFKQRIARTN